MVNKQKILAFEVIVLVVFNLPAGRELNNTVLNGEDGETGVLQGAVGAHAVDTLLRCRQTTLQAQRLTGYIVTATRAQATATIQFEYYTQVTVGGKCFNVSLEVCRHIVK